MIVPTISNFEFLRDEFPTLYTLGKEAEFLLHPDPSASLMKLRLFGEKLVDRQKAGQQEIVRQVDHYFSLADQLEARFDRAAAIVDQLPQALLAKAFSGQLVPQDPNDEPVSALLERLKTEAPAPEKGQRRKKTNSQTTLLS